VKLEGVRGHVEIVRHIVDSGVPVMGHLGLTPQSVHASGRNESAGSHQRSRETSSLAST
jgi:3-methyl-2-oxobutanoate hydroxymethyltransferase